MSSERDRIAAASSVISFDKSYLSGKFARKENENYLLWREALLIQGATEGKTIVDRYGDRRKSYLSQRQKLLEQKLRRGSSLTPSQSSGSAVEPASPLKSSGSAYGNGSASGSPGAPGSPSLTRRAEKYAFAGMHHIFQHQNAVTIVKFANNDRNLLAFSSQDGRISVCSAGVSPAKPDLLQSLEGHSDAVNDFCWSITNDVLLSCSEDKSVRAWKWSNGDCLQTLRDEFACTSVCFYPLNNNIFFYGNSKGHLKMVNMSTGKLVWKGGLASLLLSAAAASVTALEFDPAGSVLFVGDSKGQVHTYSVALRTMVVQSINKFSVTSGKPVCSLQYKSFFIRSQEIGFVAISSPENVVRVFRVENKTSKAGSKFVLEKTVAIPNGKQAIRSIFCPVAIDKDDLFLVSGGENGSVFIFDVKAKQPANRLQGHAGVVFSCSWNFDESLLASADSSGTVIVWKRVLDVSSSDLR